MLRRTVAALAFLALVACHGVRSAAPPSLAVFYLPEPSLGDSGTITIDTASLRPSVSARGAGRMVITNFQNGRYHGETVRAISEDSTVAVNAARQMILQSGAGAGLILDFQEVAPGELRSFADLLRSVTSLARTRGKSPVGIIVPAQDTVSFPTDVLSRVVDVMIVRAYGDHRPGTLPGAPATAEFIRRAVSLRAVVLGPARVIAALPLYGYRWDRHGTARAITYEGASVALNSESGAFRRDPASQFLVATGRDGWTAWVPDGRTIEYLISIVRQTGVGGVALVGLQGAAPDIAGRVAAAIRR